MAHEANLIPKPLDLLALVLNLIIGFVSVLLHLVELVQKLAILERNPCKLCPELTCSCVKLLVLPGLQKLIALVLCSFALSLMIFVELAQGI